MVAIYAIASVQSLGRKPLYGALYWAAGMAHPLLLPQDSSFTAGECLHLSLSLPQSISQNLPDTWTCLCVGHQDWSNWLWPWHMCFTFFVLSSLLLLIIRECSGPSLFLLVMSWHLILILGSASFWESITSSCSPGCLHSWDRLVLIPLGAFTTNLVARQNPF